MSDEEVGITEVDISLNAYAAGSKCLEERYAAPVVIVRVDGHRYCVVNERLSVFIPYRSTVSIDLVAKPDIKWIVWYAD